MGGLFSACNSNQIFYWVMGKTLDALFIVDLIIVAFAIYSLYRLKSSHEISKHRFISLMIVLIELIIWIVHYSFVFSAEVNIVFAMTQDIIKYMGFYYCVYFFTSQAVEILTNKENEFVYYTKLGLISTSIIQIVHWFIAFILLMIKNKRKDVEMFCQNNVWVMMRFLAIAVTLGFIFIGWRIQHIILNPLLNQQKRK